MRGNWLDGLRARLESGSPRRRRHHARQRFWQQSFGSTLPPVTRSSLKDHDRHNAFQAAVTRQAPLFSVRTQRTQSRPDACGQGSHRHAGRSPDATFGQGRRWDRRTATYASPFSVLRKHTVRFHTAGWPSVERPSVERPSVKRSSVEWSSVEWSSVEGSVRSFSRSPLSLSSLLDLPQISGSAHPC